jgi:hypothetical protein
VAERRQRHESEKREAEREIDEDRAITRIVVSAGAISVRQSRVL